MNKKSLIPILLSLMLLTGAMAGCAKPAGVSESPLTLVNLNNYFDEKSESEGLTIEDGLLGGPIDTKDIYSTYLIYGYNVINSYYFNPYEINTGRPILDIEKLQSSDSNRVMRLDEPQSTFRIVKAKSVSDFYRNMNASADFSYNGILHSGKAHVEFKLTERLKKNQVLIKGTAFHKKYKEYLQYNTPSRLIPLLSQDFIDDINALAEDRTSANKIFENYGTHLIVSYYAGGHLDFNFRYTMTESLSYEKIDTAINQADLISKGKAEYADSKELKTLNENSEFTYRVSGGKNLSATNLQELMAQNNDWVNSIADKPVLSQISDNYMSSLVPIWELVDEKAGSKLKSHFDYLVDQAGIRLAGFDYIESPLSAMYITDVMVVTAKNSDDAINKVPSNYTIVQTNPGSKERATADLNKGAGGDFIYVAYKKSPNKEEAIAYLRISYGKDTSKPPIGSSYKLIPVDLNKGCGSNSGYVYLWYRKATSSDKTVLADIGAYYGKGSSLPSGWSWVYHGNTTERADANWNAGGEYVYLVTISQPYE